MALADINWEMVDPVIEAALAEDIGPGDATSNALFGKEEIATAYMKCKAQGIVAGLPIAKRVFQHLDDNIKWENRVSEGALVMPGTVIAQCSGNRRALLSGERLALNLLQRLSGIASLTARYLAAVDRLNVKILDTRKTLPTLRVMEKYAVAVGGGTNHRFGLFDGIMIKDNHIQLAGSISEAVRRARVTNERQLPIEVETGSLAEVREALDAGADIIMLDNMSTEMMREAVSLIGGKAITEASGGVNLKSVRGIAETGVDTISVGALTHSAMALDIGMYFYK